MRLACSSPPHKYNCAKSRRARPAILACLHFGLYILHTPTHTAFHPICILIASVRLCLAPALSLRLRRLIGWASVCEWDSKSLNLISSPRVRSYSRGGGGGGRGGGGGGGGASAPAGQYPLHCSESSVPDALCFGFALTFIAFVARACGGFNFPTKYESNLHLF